jgi:NAD+ kinase
LVVPEDSIITVTARRETESICVTLDGQEVINLDAEDKIIVTRSKNKIVHLVKNSNHTYFKTLKEKFTHGSREIK